MDSIKYHKLGGSKKKKIYKGLGIFEIVGLLFALWIVVAKFAAVLFGY